MDVAQNKQCLTLVESVLEDGFLSLPNKNKLRPSKVGYEPEIYFDKEAGFRCKRDDNGNPIGQPFDVKLDDKIPET